MAIKLLQRLEELKGDRYNWETNWQDIIDYTMPNRTSVTGEDSPGEERTELIYDSTAVNALIRLGANLNSMLTNQATDWFYLSMADDNLNKLPDVRQWLSAVERTIRIQLEMSNFYTEVHEMYLDLASIGTGVMYVEERHEAGKHINFSTRHIKEVYIAENAYGEVDTLFRLFDMTKRQVVEKFAEDGNITATFKKDAKQNPDDFVEICHVVLPRADYKKGKTPLEDKPFASVWIDTELEKVILDSGYNTFPYVVPRWLKSSGEKYGRSPALNTLGDIKTLNAMMYTMLDTGNKVANPPILVPDETLELVDLRPGGITYYDTRTGNKPEPMILGANLPVTFDLLQEKRKAILEAFFTNELSYIDKDRMTAEEVRARQNENAKILGPTFGRLQMEFIDKCIARIIEILFNSVEDDGTPVLPEPPESIQGKDFRLRYVSPLATSQKLNDIQKINAGINNIGQMVQVKPDVLDRVNLDEAVEVLARLYDLPEEMVRSDEEVMAIRQARAQQQAQQIQVEQQNIASESMKHASSAQKNTAAAELNRARAEKELTNE